MSPEIIALIALGAVALLVAGLVFIRPQLRRQRLRMLFGPEYDHVIRDNRQDREAAERELLARERRHKELDLRPLDSTVRERYRAEWTAVQRQFVDSPSGAAADAERLMTSVMTDQGYPPEGHGRHLADLSVAHPYAVEHWRLAYGIAAGRGGTAGAGDVPTEELRQALMHYRVVFDQLLGAGGAGRDPRCGRDERDEAPADRMPFGDRIRHRPIRYTRRHT